LLPNFSFLVIVCKTFKKKLSLTMPASSRRKILRLQTGVNKKWTVFRWIGSTSVGEVSILGNQQSRWTRVNPIEGAERSSRRGSRGRRRGRARVREEVNLAAPEAPRPNSTSTVRSSRRASREYSWSLKVSEKFFTKISSLVRTGANLRMSPWVSTYGSFALKVSRISSLGDPMSYRQFVRQCLDDTPWQMEPDICFYVRSVVDLEHLLLDSNVSFKHDPVPVRGLILVGSDRKKTRSVLCRRCGGLFPLGTVCKHGPAPPIVPSGVEKHCDCPVPNSTVRGFCVNCNGWVRPSDRNQYPFTGNSRRGRRR